MTATQRSTSRGSPASAVFDPNGDQVGRVRDAVARIAAGTRPPRVVGLVAELPMRRRIFLPIGRIVSIDADAVVLGTGTLNLRRFEKRPGELLVLEDLLDRQVTIVDAGQPATVVDVAMECDRAGDWASDPGRGPRAHRPADAAAATCTSSSGARCAG